MILLDEVARHRHLKLFVGPRGMQIRFNGMPKDLLGYPSEMMEALTEALNAEGFSELPFSGGTLSGVITSPEKPKEGDEDGLITLEFNEVYKEFRFKILLRKEEVQKIQQLIRDYWFD